MCVYAPTISTYVCVSLFLSHLSLSVQTVLGGGGVCGGGVVRQGASSIRSQPTVHKVLQLSGYAAGESCVYPGVSARVQTG